MSWKKALDSGYVYAPYVPLQGVSSTKRPLVKTTRGKHPVITEDNIQEYFCHVSPKVGDTILLKHPLIAPIAIRKAKDHGFFAEYNFIYRHNVRAEIFIKITGIL